MRRIIFALNASPKIETLEVDRLTDLGFEIEPVKGCYKGQTEQAYILTIPRAIDLLQAYNEVLNVARLYNQESILVTLSDNSAMLVECFNEDQTFLGVFQKVESTDGLEAYTIDSRGTIWTCK